MTTIEDLREKYGDAPIPLKGFLFEAGGHRFDTYMVRHRSGSMKTRAQLALKDGTSVEIDVDTPTEEETRSKRAYVQVSSDKDLLNFYESDQHVSDFAECKRGYAQEEARILRDHISGMEAEERKLERAQDKYNKLEKSLQKAEREFNLGFTTDVRCGRLQELSADVSKWKGKLRARERGPGKPDKSFSVAIRFHLPISVKYPDVWVNAANSLRADFIKRLGVVPTVPQPISVLGLVRAEVVLRP